MGAAPQVLAIDIGASSGKAFVAALEGGRLRIEEVRRFGNGMVRAGGRLTWDVEKLLGEVRACARAAREEGWAPLSLGIDAWGVDHALLDGEGRVLPPVYAYRDAAAGGAVAAVHRSCPFEEIYAIAGIQLLPFNTIYQLAARRAEEPGVIERAHRLAMIPELLAGLLSGVFVAEETNASTTSLMDARARRWSERLLEAAGVPAGLLPRIVPAGTAVGRDVAVEGLRLDVLVPATHDTACAFLATPIAGPRAAIVSSGTWSLVGGERPEPLLTGEARRAGFTNEAGVLGTTRLLRNVMGLWLLQGCRREWGDPPYEEMDRLAAAAPEPPLIDPDDPAFLSPPSMTAAIAEACRRAGQEPPDGIGATVRCIRESLALRTREVILELERLTADPVEAVHVVGGGARDEALLQATAGAAGRPVLAGPVEATALGNALAQLLGLGLVRDLAEARAIVARSFPPRRTDPRDEARWAARRRRFEEITKGARP